MKPVTWSAARAGGVLRRPGSADDKYTRGVVGLRTGSDSYPGAAVLGVTGAWRTGPGMVRYTGPAREAVLHRRPETVTVDGRVQAWVIGSGTDATTRTAAETEALRSILTSGAAVVVDAGALDLVPLLRVEDSAPAPWIVTPHGRELAALRSATGLDPAAPGDEGGRIAQALETAAALGVTVLSKGSVTLVAEPGGSWARVEAPTAWLATAGTGDVLAGCLGTVVAGAAARAGAEDGSERLDGPTLLACGATAAWLHGRAAAVASALLAGNTAFGAADAPIVAMDVADALPRAVADALGAG
jgi:NAD(P)H-hydrate repair Nnr-like enzyme with NAD(P)H-hydrate dehydratase domain